MTPLNHLIDAEIVADQTGSNDKLSRLGKGSTIVSAGIGVLIFLLFLITREENLAILGLFYLPIAGGINVVILLIIFVKALKERKHKRRRLLTCLIMIANIPLAILIAMAGLEMLHL